MRKRVGQIAGRCRRTRCGTGVFVSASRASPRRQRVSSQHRGLKRRHRRCLRAFNSTAGSLLLQPQSRPRLLLLLPLQLSISLRGRSRSRSPLSRLFATRPRLKLPQTPIPPPHARRLRYSYRLPPLLRTPSLAPSPPFFQPLFLRSLPLRRSPPTRPPPLLRSPLTRPPPGPLLRSPLTWPPCQPSRYLTRRGRTHPHRPLLGRPASCKHPFKMLTVLHCWRVGWMPLKSGWVGWMSGSV